MAAFFQPDIVIIRHPVETGHLMPLGQQKPGQMKPDEPGGSGDEDPHQRPTPT